MAKRKPTASLQEMVHELGYTEHRRDSAVPPLQRFYSDLRPVPDNAFEQIERAFEECKKWKHILHEEGVLAIKLPGPGRTEVVIRIPGLIAGLTLFAGRDIRRRQGRSHTSGRR